MLLIAFVPHSRKSARQKGWTGSFQLEAYCWAEFKAAEFKAAGRTVYAQDRTRLGRLAT
jgi:hypothetical protein